MIRIISLFGFVLFLGGVVMWGCAHREEILSPCLPPLRYSVAEPDERFGLSKEEIVAAARSAETVWESALGKNVFEYDPEAEFAIRFVYDERQENTVRAESLESSIAEKTQEYEALKNNVSKQSEMVQSLVAEYDAKVAAYEEALRRYEQDVSYWNARGGAPEDVYEELTEDRKALNEEQKGINVLGERINALANDTNALVSTLNNTADSVNEKVFEHNSLFADMPTFHKGVYSGGDIVLYQFTSLEDAIVTLAHEFGHALGIDHIVESNAIMHAFIGEQSLDPVIATDADIDAAQQACGFGAYGFLF
jgi:hypothetical protein